MVRSASDDHVVAAVVAGDLGRAGLEVDVGDAVERGRGRRWRSAPAGCDQRRQVGAGALRQAHADRDAPLADVELGDVGVDVADGGDARDLGDGVGVDAEPRGVVGARPDDHLRRRRRGGGPRVGEAVCRPAISRCSSSAAASSPSPVSLVSDHLHGRRRRSRCPANVTRASGMSCEAAGAGDRGSAAPWRCDWASAPRSPAPLVTPPVDDGTPKPPPPPPPTWARTRARSPAGARSRSASWATACAGVGDRRARRRLDVDVVVVGVALRLQRPSAPRRRPGTIDSDEDQRRRARRRRCGGRAPSCSELT